MAGELHRQVTGEAIRTWLLIRAQARAGARGQAALPAFTKGHQQSPCDVATELAKLGFVNERGAEFVSLIEEPVASCGWPICKGKIPSRAQKGLGLWSGPDNMIHVGIVLGGTKYSDLNPAWRSAKMVRRN
jgi:hypothetical protein